MSKIQQSENKKRLTVNFTLTATKYFQIKLRSNWFGSISNL